MFNMRCLDTTTFKLHHNHQSVFKTEGYAILSHRWADYEITYDQIGEYAAELRNTRGSHCIPQLDKIFGACSIARYQGIRWMWIDSCCIDKTSSQEYQESINSMFRWYSDALVCITYMSDVRKNPGIGAEAQIFYDSQTRKPSVWFTRGWTLQELLAPRKMQFYDMTWEFLGTKEKLATALSQITRIKREYLTGAEDFRSACIAAKMSWMAGRETTREEDMAYSMLGLFNVNMTPQYGEGMGAFMRLQDLLIAKNDESLFAWRAPPEGFTAAHRSQSNSVVDLGPDEWGLLAPSPHCYAQCGNMTTQGKAVLRHRGGFTKTPQGISGPISKKDHYKTAIFTGMTVVGVIPFQIWLAVRNRTTLKFTLNCWEPNEKGSLRAVQVYLRPVQIEPRIFARTRCHELDLVRKVDTANYSTIGTVWQP
ncbi:Vegetative incompatibility protein [Paramyrothecium foliicola]|nr:Vegetative incompatibility protein [Paramyrothecium foliicola]